MLFSGYGAPAYCDYLFYPATSTGEKKVKFTVDSKYVNTHTLLGAGFLVNTGIDESGKIHGYVLYYRFSSATSVSYIYLYKIKDNVLATNFCNQGGLSDYNVSTYCDLVDTVATNPVWSSEMDISLTINPNSVAIEQKPSNAAEYTKIKTVSNLQDTNYQGFGPIVQYSSHSCSGNSMFKYSNLEMSFGSAGNGSSIYSALENAQFNDPSTNKVFVNLTGNNYTTIAAANKTELGAIQLLKTNRIRMITDYSTPLDVGYYCPEYYMGTNAVDLNSLTTTTSEDSYFGNGVSTKEGKVSVSSSIPSGYLSLNDLAHNIAAAIYNQSYDSSQGHEIGMESGAEPAASLVLRNAAGKDVASVRNGALGEDGVKIYLDTSGSIINDGDEATLTILKPGDSKSQALTPKIETSGVMKDVGYIVVTKDLNTWPAGNYTVTVSYGSGLSASREFSIGYAVNYKVDNGNTEPDAMTKFPGESVTLAKADELTPPEGMQFAYWADKNSDVTYTEGQIYKKDENLTLEAKWKLQAPTVSIEKTAGGIKASWDEVPNAEGYKVCFYQDGELVDTKNVGNDVREYTTTSIQQKEDGSVSRIVAKVMATTSVSNVIDNYGTSPAIRYPEGKSIPGGILTGPYVQGPSGSTTPGDISYAFAGYATVSSDASGNFTIKLLENVQVDATVVFPSNVTLDLNGHYIMGPDGADGATSDVAGNNGGDGSAAIKIPSGVTVITKGGSLIGGDGGKGSKGAESENSSYAGGNGGNAGPAINITSGNLVLAGTVLVPGKAGKGAAGGINTTDDPEDSAYGKAGADGSDGNEAKNIAGTIANLTVNDGTYEFSDNDANGFRVTTKYIQNGGNVKIVAEKNYGLLASSIEINGGELNSLGKQYGIYATNVAFNGGTVYANSKTTTYGVYGGSMSLGSMMEIEDGYRSSNSVVMNAVNNAVKIFAKSNIAGIFSKSIDTNGEEKDDFKLVDKMGSKLSYVEPGRDLEVYLRVNDGLGTLGERYITVPDTVKVNVDGKELDSSKYFYNKVTGRIFMENARGFIEILAESNTATLSKVGKVSSVTIPCGTELTTDDIGRYLPSTVSCDVIPPKEESADHVSLPIVWDYTSVDSSDYDPNNTFEQVFILKGYVKLPAGVSNPNDISREVAIEVTAQQALVAAGATITVDASCDDILDTTHMYDEEKGIYAHDVKVVLSSEIGGATIYYTTDGSTPNTRSKVYSSPINLRGVFGQDKSTTIKAMVVADGYQPSKVTTKKVTIHKEDTSVPEGTITLSKSDNSWSGLAERISFDTYLKKNEKISFKAVDNESGVASIEYIILDKEDLIEGASDYGLHASDNLTGEQVESLVSANADLNWTPYSESISLPYGNIIVVFKAVNGDGKAGYYSTNGIVNDNQLPIFTNENGTTYSSGETFVANRKKIYIGEDNIDLVEVTIDGETEERSVASEVINGVTRYYVSLVPNENEQEIKVTDKAGNSATYKCNVNAIVNVESLVPSIEKAIAKNKVKTYEAGETYDISDMFEVGSNAGEKTFRILTEEEVAEALANGKIDVNIADYTVGKGRIEANAIVTSGAGCFVVALDTEKTGKYAATTTYGYYIVKHGIGSGSFTLEDASVIEGFKPEFESDNYSDEDIVVLYKENETKDESQFTDSLKEALKNKGDSVSSVDVLTAAGFSAEAPTKGGQYTAVCVFKKNALYEDCCIDKVVNLNKAKLLKILPTTAITGIKNGTELTGENMNLPAKVSVVVECKTDTPSKYGENTKIIEVPITWRTDSFASGTYDKDVKDAQTFSIYGDVSIPEDYDDNGILLINSQAITVDEFIDETIEKEHKFTNYVSDNNATLTTNGTKTAVCDNGCGEKHTIEDPKTAFGGKGTSSSKEDESADGSLWTEINRSKDAPEVSIEGMSVDLANELLTEEEKEEIADGVEAKVFLDIMNGKDTVKDTEKQAISECTDFVAGQYVDVNLYKKIGRAGAIKISDMGDNYITITFRVDDSLYEVPENTTRTYGLVSVHDGVAKAIDIIKHDEKKREITFKTNKFSIYAVTYHDTAVEPTAAPTAAPTVEPTAAPTAAPTVAPTVEPTVAPTAEPTAAPTIEPTVAPTAEPTLKPTSVPTVVPTKAPEADQSKLSGNQISKLDLPILLAKGKAKGDTKINLSWNKQSTATGYEVYWSYCGNKNKFQKLANVIAGKKLAISHSKLKKDKAYKYYIVSYKEVDGNKVFLSRSPQIHVAMKFNKQTNAKKIKVKQLNVLLKPKATSKISATIVRENTKKKKVLAHAAVLRYYTSDKKIAVVNSKGKITSKSKGSCIIYVVANNGVATKIKLTVK